METEVIRAAISADARAMAAIYNHYVTETVVTFEEAPIEAAEMERRLRDVQSADLPWLVAERAGQVLGYSYAAPWKTRSAYRFSVEITVYLSPESAGRGLGSRLYHALFAALHDRGVHAVIGGVALPNAASVALHEKFGMSKVAHFEQVGYKFDRWVDVAYWQRVLENT